MFKATIRLSVFILLLGFMTACNPNDGGTITRNNVNNPNMLDVNDNFDRGNRFNMNRNGNRLDRNNMMDGNNLNRNNLMENNILDPNNDGLDMDMDTDINWNNNRDGLFEIQREGVRNNNRIRMDR